MKDLFMTYTRWYDKDENLKVIMHALEKMDQDAKIAVASDLIQIILNERTADSDEFIDKINENYFPDRNRWYDTDETIYSAIEMLKHTQGEKKKELIREIFYSILHFNQQEKNDK